MTEKTGLQRRIESGKPILVAEMSPPRGGNPAQLRSAVKGYVGKVHALGISDNRDGVHMSAVAAASLAISEGLEPILHVTTRDRNRIALVSDYLGARALGIQNVLCTSGTHQTLGRCGHARNVFDLDSIQLLGMYSGLTGDGSLVGEDGFEEAGPFCLGATASPYADPMEMQLIRLSKTIAAGASFIITQPVFDLERFRQWWSEVSRRGMHENVAILAGIQPLADAEQAKICAEQRPDPRIPEAIRRRLSAPDDKKRQREAGLEIALETVQQLSGLKGLRGFEVRGDGNADMAIEFIERSGLGKD